MAKDDKIKVSVMLLILPPANISMLILLTNLLVAVVLYMCFVHVHVPKSLDSHNACNVTSESLLNYQRDYLEML